MGAGGNVTQFKDGQQTSTRNKTAFSIEMKNTPGSTSNFMDRMETPLSLRSNGCGGSMMMEGLFTPASSRYSNSGQEDSGGSRGTPAFYGNTRLTTPRTPQEFHTP
jgi:hypothetical protein